MLPLIPKGDLIMKTSQLRISNPLSIILTGCCAALLLAGNAARADYNVPARMAWWSDARFGMFIHFGSYSYLGRGEWAFSAENWSKTNYQTQVSAHFYPSNFNAAAIVSAAKAAGMKYIVITAKHHEGYAMWRSQVPSFTDVTGTTLYNLYDYSGFQRDVLRELKNECDGQGIKFCLYYSILDWCHPSQTNNPSAYFSVMSSLTAKTNYVTDMKAQLTELITNYQPAVLWFDGDWCGNPNPATLNNWWVHADATNLYSFLLSLKPDLVVNERVKRGLGLGDFECPEQTVPAAALARPWETCATMNGAWGYASWAEGNYRSTTTLLREMVQVISREGNYLLNIGPKGDGSMTLGSTNVLAQFATWMNVHGESVHGTTGSPFGTSEPSWGYYTKRAGKLYAHVLTWPGTQLAIPALSNTITRVYLLNDTNTSLSYADNGAGITITLPASEPNAMDSVVAIEMNGVPIPAVSSLALRSTGGTATASTQQAGETAANAFDGSTATKWFNGNGGTTGWLQYQFGGTAWAVSQYRIASANDVPGRDPRNWQLQGSTNGVNWVTLDTRANQTFAARFSFNTYNLTNILAFPYYRLNITANNGDGAGLQLSELQLFAEPPGPQGLVASWTNGQVALNWSRLTGATGYLVKRSTNSGSGFAAIAGMGGTNYTDSAVTNGTTYYYVVSATNALGASPNSIEVSATPGVTTNLLVNPSFEWNTAGAIISAKIATGFDLPENNVAGWINAGATFADSGVDYHGHNSNVAQSGTVFAYCDQGDSGAYQITSYQMNAGDQIKLTWWAKSSWGNAGQSVSLLRANASPSDFASLTALTTSTAALNNTLGGGEYTQYTLTYTATAAEAGKYLAVAFRAPGAPGSWAAFDDFSLTVAVAPAKPAGVTGSAGHGTALLTWPVVENAASYHVKRSPIAGGPHSLVANVTSLAFTNIGLSNGTRYYFVISGTNSVGAGADSDEVAVRPISTNPATLAAASLSANQLQIVWPREHTGWVLQSQTNSLAAGLGTNWVNIACSTETNGLGLSPAPTSGSTFFRLVRP
jgi:alpha-L-fucosidase